MKSDESQGASSCVPRWEWAGSTPGITKFQPFPGEGSQNSSFFQGEDPNIPAFSRGKKTPKFPPSPGEGSQNFSLFQGEKTPNFQLFPEGGSQYSSFFQGKKRQNSCLFQGEDPKIPAMSRGVIPKFQLFPGNGSQNSCLFQNKDPQIPTFSRGRIPKFPPFPGGNPKFGPKCGRVGARFTLEMVVEWEEGERERMGS